MVHASLGWNKCVATPKFGIPQGHQRLVRWFGWIIFWVLGAIYLSYPAYCILPHTMASGTECGPRQVDHGPSRESSTRVSSVSAKEAHTLEVRCQSVVFVCVLKVAIYGHGG